MIRDAEVVKPAPLSARRSRSTMLRYAVLLRRVVELPLESWRLLQ